jgi:E3 ubiquitin-protein ligase HUWE1
MLLSILQDGSGDLAAMDKCFSHMSFRNTKPHSQSSKVSSKQKAVSDYPNGLSLPNDIVPELRARRCLEALTFIVSSNELSSLFFLTEHELPVGLRKAASKKGKGKEKQSSPTHYPIVLLLSLLERESLLKTSSIMESVVGLLASVTRPLTSLKDAKKNQEQPTRSTNQTAEETSSSNSPTAMTTDEPPANVPGRCYKSYILILLFIIISSTHFAYCYRRSQA